MIDLHCHSTCSDGFYTPEQLVEMAKDMELSAFSVSDHDTIEGALRAKKKGDEIGVRVIPAVEISASYWEYPIHILGYDFDLESDEMKTALEEINLYRKNRAKTMIENINRELMQERKIPVDIEEILKLGIEKPIIRIDLARYLFENGYVSSVQEAFDKWLIKYNIPNRGFSVKQAIGLIHHAGGVAVLAHPGSESISLQIITNNIQEQTKIIMDFQSQWLDGIETYRFHQTQEMENAYREIADSLGLIPTGGSDFHSPGSDTWAPSIGSNHAPDSIVDRILKLGEKRKKDWRL